MLNISDQSYEKYAVIKPPEIEVGNEKVTRIIIDSRIRNTDLYPEPNDYEIVLDDDINDVISAQLMYTDIPFSSYLINKNYNTIYIEINGTMNNIVLDVGNYDKPKLASEIQEKMDAVLGAGTINISYIEKLDKYRFTGSAAYSIKFKNRTNTFAQLLGFSFKKDYDAVNQSGSFVIDPEFRVNFNFINYLIMDIEQFDLLKSSNEDLNRSFAIIPKQLLHRNIVDQFLYTKKFTPPIARLHKLRIRLYDNLGNKYDFQNQDHQFELVIKSFKQKRKYST
jgi:hypothetical protein